MKEYRNLINSSDILDIVEGKLTTEELKTKILNRYYRFCQNDAERLEVEALIESGFAHFLPLLNNLTQEEYESITRYSSKLGALSYEINNALRTGLPLSPVNKYVVGNLDQVMERFVLPEATIVYRAIKADFLNGQSPEELLGMELFEAGYMSSSLSIEDSYAYFKEYEIVLEIVLPVGIKCLYIEWFKGANDESELLISRGQTIEINDVRKGLVNGSEKIIYSCSIATKKLTNDGDNLKR